jgi:hypothetical protein
MPVLNIEKFSICPATGILCAMEFDPRRTIGQGAGAGQRASRFYVEEATLS